MVNNNAVPLDVDATYGDAPTALPPSAQAPIDVDSLYGASAKMQQAGENAAKNLEFERSPNYPTAAMTDVSAQDAMTAYGAGKLVANAPAISTTVGEGFNALKQNAPNVIKGLLSSPSSVGEEMESGEEAAGIASDTLPVRRGTIAKFPGLDGLPTNTPPVEAPTVAPMVYPKDTNTFLNFARQRVDSLGEQMQPQELADYRTTLNTMFKSGEIKPGTKPYALASQLYTDTNSLFENAVAGRADLNEIYKYSKVVPNFMTGLGTIAKKYGPRVATGVLELGAGGALAGGLYQGIKHLF